MIQRTLKGILKVAAELLYDPFNDRTCLRFLEFCKFFLAFSVGIIKMNSEWAMKSSLTVCANIFKLEISIKIDYAQSR